MKSVCVQSVKHFWHAHPIIIPIATFVPLIHQYVQWSPNTITLFFMWDVLRCDFSINCFSGLSGPSIFLVLISWTLTHCIIYHVFSTYIAKVKIPHLLHLYKGDMFRLSNCLSGPSSYFKENSLHTQITWRYKGIHVNCLIFVQFKPKSEHADTF